ncbi:MAG: MFS transporter, partial [Firmicutes bacterium]|nr:MFS transporter [Bacillota bacterium]
MRREDLTLRNKICYGIGGICDNTLYTLTGTYLLLFLTTVAGVSPAVAGTISAAGSLWEAFAGP